MNWRIVSPLLATLAIATQAAAASASVCHDGVWDDGEFCGRDAVLVTGVAEMNHDCTVGLLDLLLWLPEFTLVGPGLSADLNGNGAVDIMDLSVLLGDFGLSATPCVPSGMLPDGCQGTIALSFDSNPAVIDSTHTQAPGAGHVNIVTDGWSDPWIIEYAVETSSNVAIVLHHETAYPHWQLAGIPVICTPDPQHSWGAFIKTGGASWPASPIIFNRLDYNLLNGDPAWIKLTPVPACNGNSRIRWGPQEGNRSFDFINVMNAGINGPAPPGESTCAFPLPLLSLNPLWVLAAVLGGSALVWRRLRARSA